MYLMCEFYWNKKQAEQLPGRLNQLNILRCWLGVLYEQCTTDLGALPIMNAELISKQVQLVKSPRVSMQINNYSNFNP